MTIWSKLLVLILSFVVSLNLIAQTQTSGGGGLPGQEPEDYPVEYEHEQTFIKLLKSKWKKCRLRSSPPKDLLSFYHYFNPERLSLDPNEILQNWFEARQDCRERRRAYRPSRDHHKLECLMSKEIKKPLIKLLQNNDIDIYLQKVHGLPAADAQKVKVFYVDLILGD